MPGWGGEFEPELSSLSGKVNVFYHMEVFISKKNSLSWEDYLVGKFYKKVTVANLAFFKTVNDQSRHLGGREVGFRAYQFQMFKRPGGLPQGGR